MHIGWLVRAKRYHFDFYSHFLSSNSLFFASDVYTYQKGKWKLKPDPFEDIKIYAQKYPLKLSFGYEQNIKWFSWHWTKFLCYCYIRVDRVYHHNKNEAFTYLGIQQKQQIDWIKDITLRSCSHGKCASKNGDYSLFLFVVLPLFFVAKYRCEDVNELSRL